MSCVESCDVESALMRPGAMAPELTCMTRDSWYPGGIRGGARIYDRLQTKDVMEELLSAKNVILVGQNVSYDFGVLGAEFPDLLPLIFQAYKDNRVTDTMIRQQLIDISKGIYRGYLDDSGVWQKLGYSLFDLVRRHKGQLLKKDGWRLRYGGFRDIPLDRWVNKARQLQDEARILLTREGPKPPDERYYDGYDPKDLLAILEDEPEQVLRYPLDDASTTLDVYLAQEKEAYRDDLLDVLHSQYREAYAAFALHLSSCWGIRTNKAGVEALEKETQLAITDVKQRLMVEGLVRADGSRDTKKAAVHMAMVCERDGLVLRKTKTGGVCLDADACDACGDELMETYAEYSTLNKTLTADIPMLLKGTEHPVHPRYSIAETGRTTCSGPNIQNLRRTVGVREAFTPRTGRCYLQADYPSLELYTLAQSCIHIVGASRLAEALNAGLDPHTAMASDILGISYEEAIARRKSKDKDMEMARQTSKVANFGFPGGLGVDALCKFAHKNYGVEITPPRAKALKKQWLSAWPEMREYFARVNAMIGIDGTAEIVIPGTGFVRGGAFFCPACNTFFQGLGAACAKRAMCLVSEAQYTIPQSPLYGSRTIAFVHDELILESDNNNTVHDAAYELARLMSVAACELLPDVPIPVARIEPLAMLYWSKEATSVFDENKRLVPWEAKAA